MKMYKVAYSGWTVVTVEAKSPKDAEDKFWADGLNDLYDAEIGEVIEASKGFDEVGGFAEANES